MGPGSDGAVSGTVTFLFTDVEGSTQRWERDRAAMSTALRRHDALVREAVVDNGGQVFKTVGDAFHGVFSTAAQAMAAAIAAQRALMAEDFSNVQGAPVRIALHSGVAEMRDGDYFGPTVNRVARLLSIGHGGQILVSSATAQLLGGELPADASLRDLGPHRLKDLARAEQVYQVVADGIPSDFPPLRSLDELPNNLPLQLTSFVGRDDDDVQIKALLQANRLVTLCGIGGAGKTRCAIQVGADQLDRFSDGVWLVELAPIADPALVPSAIAKTLGIRESPTVPLLETIVAHLRARRLLLLLDNCEHIIEGAREAAAAILQSCPEVRILATSREALNITGEQLFRLPSLAVPPAQGALTAQTARPYGAVALFTDRAIASDARFTLTDDNARYVAEISQRLDGIPLAIELAAARIKVLSPKELAQKLNERFRLLTGGDKSALPRHRTMRALIDWSYDLLSDEERAFFRKLSVFAGGFTLETAAAVCGDAATDELGVLELLTSLVDKSLVQSDAAETVTRYRLLESTRQYAREKLTEHGEEPAAARAHAAAFLALAMRFDHFYDSTPDDEWFPHVEPELENWRTALEWTLLARGDVPLGQRLAGELGREWAFLTAAEGLRWIQCAQKTSDETTPLDVLARLDLAEAQLAGVLLLHKVCYVAADRALARYRELGDARRIAESQRHAGRALVFTGKAAEGEAVLREALDQFRALGARTLVGATLENIAIARNAQGDLAAARSYFTEALAIFRSTGAERLKASLASNLAEAEFWDGNAEAAIKLSQEALASDRLTTFNNRALLMGNMAAYWTSLERYDVSREHAREALRTARDTHYEVALLWALQHLAAIAALRPAPDERRERDDRARAARLFAYVDARLGVLEALREYTEIQEYEKVVNVLESFFTANELKQLRGEGEAWPEEDAVAEALRI
jgi:predicted ATPase/class 3 adenylate cyclase